MNLLRKYWPLLAFALLVIGLTVWVDNRATPPPLAPAQEEAVKATIAADQKQVGTDTAKAHQAAASGHTSYEAGTAYAGVATILHQQSKPHAKPTPSGDTAARRLQRQLAAY